MHLSDALRRSCRVYSPSTLFLDQESNTNVTYKSAWDIILCHAKWIHQQIKDTITPTAIFTTNPINNAPLIVIAYLSSNHPDLFLSVMGCIHLNHHFHDPSQESSFHVLPAMLNFRWTAHEIARALSASDQNNRQHPLTTIIIYGEEMKQTAEKSVEIISTQQNNHRAVAFSLPTLSKTPLGTLRQMNPDIFPTKDMICDQHQRDGKDVPQNMIYSDALIIFTSGSTGGPKGVRLSHSALFTQSLAKLLPPCSYDADTRMVASTVPFFHIGGFSSALAIVLAGGSLLFPPTTFTSISNDQSYPTTEKSSVFQPANILKSMIPSLQQSPAPSNFSNDISSNTIVLVPAMLYALLAEIQKQSFFLYSNQDNNNGSPSPFSHIKLVLLGGQGISKEQLEETIPIFPNARIVQTFACTEAASSITFAQLYPKRSSEIIQHSHSTYSRNDDSPYQGDYVGIPPPHIQVAIFPNHHNNNSNSSTNSSSVKQNGISFLPPYQVGLIGTKGPHVMNGYWNRRGDSTSSSTTTQPSWYVTNDLGYLDERNRLFFCGRANDVIRTGGETVFATEVERILRLHENIKDCAVLALPDNRFGEVVSAAIVWRNKKVEVEKGIPVLHDSNDSISNVSLKVLQRIRNHCAEHQLAGYKRPRKIYTIHGDLPRNTSGKVLKLKLKEMLMKDVTSARSKL